MAFVAGGATAAFYGWFPLYLPELFPTSIRATCQGFSFNFGRVLSAIGSLQTATVQAWFAKGIAPELVEIEAFPAVAEIPRFMRWTPVDDFGGKADRHAVAWRHLLPALERLE